MNSIVVISGGSAANSIGKPYSISDNGGSTSELLRVLGGPSIGDLRARLTRLIDESVSPERKAIKELLSYRLPSQGDIRPIRDEWALIVQGQHHLWDSISTEKKEAIRGFLVMFNFEILKRAYKNFNFRNGSIGNFFLTGARLFFGSLEAAIFIFASITGIDENTSVLPVIVTNHTASIAAELQDGTTLRGQCEISHPGSLSRQKKPNDTFAGPTLSQAAQMDGNDEESSNMNLVFDKDTDEKLSAAVGRIYYMNEFGQEVFPWPNPKYIAHLNRADTLVYSIGSLYTSIMPCLILRRVGLTINNSPSLKYKILILNGTNDRETGGYSAVDFIQAITEALNQSKWVDTKPGFYDDKEEYEGYPLPIEKPCQHVALRAKHLQSPPSAFITHMIYLTQSRVRVDVEEITSLGIKCVPVVAPGDAYTAESLHGALLQIISQR
ncbi:hypothetical protein BJV82DRAFT_697883 [Fennellomyces sp. T-0311]|nr:hypothetical protein BJV82DRAFT_697883 [Fennellomyces sp. T-0311]